MKDMTEAIPLEPSEAAGLHLRSQERPPVSGRVPDKCPDLTFSVLKVERRVSMVGDITLNPLGVTELHLRSQEDPPMSGRVPDNKYLILSF